MAEQSELSAQQKLSQLEGSITDFIKELALSVVPQLKEIDPEVRAEFLLAALAILNKDKQ